MMNTGDAECKRGANANATDLQIGACSTPRPMRTRKEWMSTNGLNREAISEIERLMRERGYSRSQLARLLKVSRVTVTQMLAPTSKMSLSRLERVVRKMGYTVHLVIEPQIKQRYMESE